MSPRAGKRGKQPEAKIKEAIRDYLRLRGFFVFHVHQDMYSYPGISDLLALRDGITYYIEVKQPGKKQRDSQIDFQRDVEAHKAVYKVMESLTDAMNFCDDIIGKPAL